MTPRRLSILEVGVDSVFHTIVLFSIYLLVVGHNAPGGGFVGGLVAGAALVLRYVSGGPTELRRTVPFQPEAFFGVGLLLAVGTGLVPALRGDAFLESGSVKLHPPLLGEVKITSTLVFDTGVYLVVIGLVLMVLAVLGTTEEEPADAGEEAGT